MCKVLFHAVMQFQSKQVQNFLCEVDRKTRTRLLFASAVTTTAKRLV